MPVVFWKTVPGRKLELLRIGIRNKILFFVYPVRYRYSKLSPNNNIKTLIAENTNDEIDLLPS